MDFSKKVMAFSAIASCAMTQMISGGVMAQPTSNTTPPPSRNQPQGNVRPATAQQLKSFAAKFQTDVYKGCAQNPRRDLKNPTGFCDCYARSFTTRYSPEQLLVISRIGSQSRQNANFIAVMMSPEIRACSASNR